MNKSTMRFLIFFTTFFLFLNLAAGEDPDKSAFLKDYPHLKNYVHTPEPSGLKAGIGFSPVALAKNRLMLSLSFLQLHHISKWFDIEIVSLNFGYSRAETSKYSSYHFIVRTAPKLRIFDFLSIGPVGAYEYVSFPNIEKKVYRDEFFTPAESFSTKDFIWGVMVSQHFTYHNDYIIKLNEFLYKQTYSVKKTESDWNIWFDDEKLQGDLEPIEATYIVGMEICFLF